MTKESKQNKRFVEIKDLFKSPNGTKETLELELCDSDFPSIPLMGKIHLEATMLRSSEGIIFIPDSVKATQMATCNRCMKSMKISLSFKGEEWLFYDKAPKTYDDLNELKRIDKSKMQIEILDVLRQEIELHLDENPACEPICVEFKEVKSGVKALAGLKDMFKEID